MNPEISIIIPTHNRYALLSRTLDALGRQTEPPQNYEVIVVADGCQDETVAAIKRLSTPYRLTLIEQPQSGPGAARNRGAEAASAPILLFLDDDVEPEPEFVRAHLNAHKRWPEDVILGYSPFSDELDENDYANIKFKEDWIRFFEMQAQITHRFNYSDLTTANVSISRKLFEEVGCFDERFNRGSWEDYELGLRLLKRRSRFRFVNEAIGKHHAKKSEIFFVNAYFNYGRTHIILIRKHPEILPLIPFAYIVDKQEYCASAPYVCFHLNPNKFLFKLLWLNPVIGKLIALGFKMRLKFLRIYSNIDSYNRVFDSLKSYQYWRGVQAELGSFAAAKQLAIDALNAPVYFNEIKIDIKTDLNRIDEILSRRPVDAVCLHYGNWSIGRIEPIMGTEPLRSPHIYGALIYFMQTNKDLSCKLLLPLLKNKVMIDLIYHGLIDNKQLVAMNNKIFFDRGWHNLEIWNGIDTRWMMDEAILGISSDETRMAKLNFRAKSFYHSRTLEIYAGIQQVGKWIVPTEFIEITTDILLSKGVNFLRLHVPEGCEKPRTYWRLMNRDSRCLGIAVQNMLLASSNLSREKNCSVNHLIDTVRSTPTEA